MFKKKQMSEEERAMEAQEDFIEGQDQQIHLDNMQRKEFQYASNMTPEDYFQYRKFANIPEAQAELPGLVDKDVIFANLNSAQITENKFLAETIAICEEVLVKEQDVMFMDNNGNPKIAKDQLLFDEDFRPILKYLKTGYKFDLAASRATGDTRATMQDISSFNTINKSIQKKKADDNQSRWGFGRG